MPGRNDLCPCGSGKKYKSCCMARDKAEQAERMTWERAASDMRAALIGFAREPEFVQDVAAGLGLFWQDRYTAQTIHQMSVDESLRFFDWFAHDYTLRTRGRRLIEVYRDEVANTLQEPEAVTLDAWIASLPGSAFVLEQTDPDQGCVHIRDLLLDRALIIHDTAAAQHGQAGQILLARPLPEWMAPGETRLRLAGATAVLPAEEQEKLLQFIQQARQAYLTDHPDTDMAEFLRHRAYLLTHYALDYADREGRPAVAAQDPSAKKLSGQTLRRIVNWGQSKIKLT